MQKAKKNKGIKNKNTVNSTKMEDAEIKIKRKFVKVQINDKIIKFQLDSSSDKWTNLEENWQTNY